MTLSNFNNTINSRLDLVVENLYQSKSVQAVHDTVKEACKDITGDKTIKKLNDLLKDILKCKTVAMALKTVYNFYLKGNGEGVI